MPCLAQLQAEKVTHPTISVANGVMRFRPPTTSPPTNLKPSQTNSFKPTHWATVERPCVCTACLPRTTIGKYNTFGDPRSALAYKITSVNHGQLFPSQPPKAQSVRWSSSYQTVDNIKFLHGYDLETSERKYVSISACLITIMTFSCARQLKLAQSQRNQEKASHKSCARKGKVAKICHILISSASLQKSWFTNKAAKLFLQ